jgi:hypothetical protein
MITKHSIAVVVACGLATGCSESPTGPTSALVGQAGGELSRQAPNTTGITIVQGSIVLDFASPGEPTGERSVSLRGTRGFRLDATPARTGRDPAVLCRETPECVPGAAISLNSFWSGGDLSGTATLQGRTFVNLGSLSSTSSATIALWGTVIAPPRAETATVTAPFTLEGLFFDGAASIREELEGRGTATVFLRWAEAIDSWFVTRVQFDFRGQSGR